MAEIDQITGKLGTIKSSVKVRSREGSEEAGEDETNNIESVVEKINEVADKLSGVQSALETGLMSGGEEREQLGTALLLAEIRKRADLETISKLKKEMFTAVHNVQRRLLEEQVGTSSSSNHRLNFYFFSSDSCPISPSPRETIPSRPC